MTSSLDHRRYLDDAPNFRPRQGRALFERIGGQPTVDRLVGALYARIENDPTVRALFGRDLTNERRHQKRFFCEWLGGEARYSESAWAGLYQRHEAPTSAHPSRSSLTSLRRS